MPRPLPHHTPHHLSLFTPTCGDLHPLPQVVAIRTILHLLMHAPNTHGFTSSNTNPILSKPSSNSITLSRPTTPRTSKPYNPMVEVNSNPTRYPTPFHMPTHLSSKWHRRTQTPSYHQNGPILAHASLPLTYWDHSFTTAIYLINRLPTPSLPNTISPLQTLTKQVPNYKHLKSFGCLCFPLLTPYNCNKLQFKSTQCINRGPSPQHKGFKCLCPTC